MLRRALVVSLLALALAPAGASAGSSLWATINVCDTPSNPDTVGIRASMPGTGRKGTMFMRFRIQYYSRREQRWHNVDTNGDSGFVRVGSSRYRRREAGWGFTLLPPPDGSSYVVRGRVDFEWRRGGKVRKHHWRITHEGHRSAAGADPAGYSASVCEIR